MGARCVDKPERYLHKSGAEAMLFPSGAFIHSQHHACDFIRAGIAARPRGKMPRGGEGRYKKSPDLAEPPRAADVDCNNALCRYSNIWPPYFNIWSTLTFSRPCQGSQAPGPWTWNVPHHYHTYHCQFWSKCNKVPNGRMYAAPVTGNIIRWDAHHCHLEERSLCIVWSCST